MHYCHGFQKIDKFFLFNKLPMKFSFHLMKAIDFLDAAIHIDVSRGMMLHSTLI